MLNLGVLAKVLALDSSSSKVLSWQVHPARNRPGIALCAAGVIALAAWICADLMEHFGWAVLAVVVLVVGANRFFFPTRYELDDEGITARFPLKTSRYRWAELRRFVYDRSGGFLSPRAKRSFLDEYRGISLLFPDDSQEIIQEICNRLPAEAIVREIQPGPPQRDKERTPCGG